MSKKAVKHTQADRTGHSVSQAGAAMPPRLGQSEQPSTFVPSSRNFLSFLGIFGPMGTARPASLAGAGRRDWRGSSGRAGPALRNGRSPAYPRHARRCGHVRQHLSPLTSIPVLSPLDPTGRQKTPSKSGSSVQDQMQASGEHSQSDYQAKLWASVDPLGRDVCAARGQACRLRSGLQIHLRFVKHAEPGGRKRKELMRTAYAGRAFADFQEVALAAYESRCGGSRFSGFWMIPNVIDIARMP